MGSDGEWDLNVVDLGLRGWRGIDGDGGMFEGFGWLLVLKVDNVVVEVGVCGIVEDVEGEGVGNGGLGVGVGFDEGLGDGGERGNRVD